MKMLIKRQAGKWVPLLLVVTLLLLGTVQAAPYEKESRVCFIGDSITHLGFYPYYVRLFYTLRKPDQPVHFFNCGIAGGTAKTANDVYDWDIKAKHINAATIMLGMNDVGSKYGPLHQAPDVLKHNTIKQKTAIANITLLIDRLLADNVAVSLITPSIYDQTATLVSKKPNLIGKNDALTYISKQINALAVTYSLPLIDFQKATLSANAKIQQQDPKATVIGKDRVHPAELGHFIMAHEFITQQAFSPLVSKTVIDVHKQKVTTAISNQVTDLNVSNKEVSFTSLESSLPFPIPEAAKPALDFIPFNEALNQQQLIVQGLNAGLWSVSIDNIDIGSYSADVLNTGINLAENSKTPMYQQALNVAEISFMASELDAKTLRSVAWIKTFLLRNKQLDINDQKAVKAHIANKLPKNIFHQNRAKSYFANVEQKDEIEQRIADLFKQSYQLSQPKAHTFILRKL